jgi:hypothetical protein
VPGENEEPKPSGSDIGGLLADLLEGARRRNLSSNSLAAYERTWRAFLAWAAAAGLDPRVLSFPTAPEAYRFLGEGKSAASLKQIRAATTADLLSKTTAKPARGFFNNKAFAAI